MKWLKGNAGWVGSLIAAMVILVGWLSGAFGHVVAMEAEPVAREVVEQEMKIHELRMEPRLQAIETEQKAQSVTSESRWKENLEIQKQILKEVRK